MRLIFKGYLCVLVFHASAAAFVREFSCCPPAPALLLQMAVSRGVC
jgi:hypothetical protein